MSSSQWSTQHAVAEYKNLEANAIAVDSTGGYAFLAGRRTFALVDLDNPTELVKRLPRPLQKYDVTVAEWCPHSTRQHSIAVASGERLDIYKWNNGSLSNELGFRAHTRNVTDLNWNKEDPNLIATCSFDSTVLIWDTRDSKRPKTTLKAVASAFQVKWNKHSSTKIASAHDNDLRIWDCRKPKTPLQCVTAHSAKIYSLDWSPSNPNHLVSSATDYSVRFFDISKPRKEENFKTIELQSHAWKTCYTPFGDGIVTVLVPRLIHGENSLLLWSLQDTSSTVAHTFIGHTDMVLGVEWRSGSSTLSSTHQMVTWSRDNSLRIWKIDQPLKKVYSQEESGSIEEENDSADSKTYLSGDTDGQECIDLAIEKEITVMPESLDDSIVTSPIRQHMALQPDIKVYDDCSSDAQDTLKMKPSPPTSLELSKCVERKIEGSKIPDCLPDHHSSSSSSQLATPSTPGSLGRPSMLTSLQQEFYSLVDTASFVDANVDISTDLERQVCQVTARHGIHELGLTIFCPSGYPKFASPKFRFSFGPTIDSSIETNLLNALTTAANQKLKKKKPSLEHCISVLISEMKNLPEEDQSTTIEIPLGVSGIDYINNISDLDHLDHIPFPRTSGARFSTFGVLVCFSRPTYAKKYSSCTEQFTPKSMSALWHYLNSYPSQMVSSVPTSPKYSCVRSPVNNPFDQISLSSYFYHDKMLKNKRNKNEEEKMKKNCVLYDVSSLLPVSKSLGAAYILDDRDIVRSCCVNRDAAAAIGRRDLVQVWSIASNILSLPPDHDFQNTGFPWAKHPFASKFINSIITHYLGEFDIQTVAMLTCIFGEKMQSAPQLSQKRKGRPENSSHRLLDQLWRKTGGSLYNTIHNINTNTEARISIGETIRHNRSNSEGSLAESQRALIDTDNVTEATPDTEIDKFSYLDSSKFQQYDEIRRAYSDILYQWGFFKQRAMILKYVQLLPSTLKVGQFQVMCCYCGQSARSPYCLICHRRNFSCAICRIYVLGSSNFCIVCGHGGHTYHMEDWFRLNKECPTGCGCVCIEEMKQLFE